MNEKNANYVFLGLTGCGKTTYFALMAQLLQDVGNETDLYKFKYLSPCDESTHIGCDGGEEKVDESVENWKDTTSDFIYDCIRRIRNQGWPVKTQSFTDVYSCELQMTKVGLLKRLNPLARTKITLNYFDFPGESFELLFGKRKVSSDVKKVRDEIKNAEGIFLIIDAEQMFNDVRTQELTNMMVHLLDSGYVAKKKLAIVFSKVDLFFGMKVLEDGRELEKIFKETYGNANSRLDPKLLSYSFFPVKSFKKIVIPDDGSDPRPAADYEFDLSLLAPIEWMTEFKLTKKPS